MSLFTGTAAGHEALFKALKHAACGYGTISNQSIGSNVGNGTLTNVEGRASAVTEVITISMTGPTTFNVSGSVSGAMASGFVAHTYDNGKIHFIVNDGAIDFVNGDTFYFNVTRGRTHTDGTVWDLLYESEGGSSGYMYLRGYGSSSSDEIYLYLRHFKSVTTGYYNIEIAAMSSFNVALVASPASQLGFSGYVYLTLWQNNINYWFMINRRRIIVVSHVSSNYETAYMGWYLPEGTPIEHPYPIMVAASHGTSTGKYSDSTVAHGSIFNPAANSCFIRHFDGSYINFRNDQANEVVYPWKAISTENIAAEEIRTASGGGYLIMEASLTSTHGGGNNYGILDGVYWVSGFGNASENTFVMDSSTFLVVQDAHRIGDNNFCAIRME